MPIGIYSRYARNTANIIIHKTVLKERNTGINCLSLIKWQYNKIMVLGM